MITQRKEKKKRIFSNADVRLVAIVTAPSSAAVLAVLVSKSGAVLAVTTLTLSLMYTKTSEASSVLTSLIEPRVCAEALLLLLLLLLLLVTLWRWKACLALVADAVSGRAGTAGLTDSGRGSSAL